MSSSLVCTTLLFLAMSMTHELRVPGMRRFGVLYATLPVLVHWCVNGKSAMQGLVARS
jgi:hypothetical protein